MCSNKGLKRWNSPTNLLSPFDFIYWGAGDLCLCEIFKICFDFVHWGQLSIFKKLARALLMCITALYIICHVIGQTSGQQQCWVGVPGRMYIQNWVHFGFGTFCIWFLSFNKLFDIAAVTWVLNFLKRAGYPQVGVRYCHHDQHWFNIFLPREHRSNSPQMCSNMR